MSSWAGRCTKGQERVPARQETGPPDGPCKIATMSLQTRRTDEPRPYFGGNSNAWHSD